MKRGVFVLLALLATATGLQAQRRGQTCDLNPNGAQGRLQVINQGTPMQVTYFSGRTEIRCTGDVSVAADSIMSVGSSNTRYFIGRVVYSDPDKTVTASRMTQFANEGRVSAQGSVTFTDKKNNSIVRGGENMDYYEAGSSGNTEARAVVFGGSPHAVLRQQGAPAAGPQSDSTSIIVDAPQMEMRGERYFKGSNGVKLVRGEVRANAAEVEYDRAENRMKLTGSAQVLGDQFKLTGGVIDGILEGNRFREVSAEFRAVLTAEDLRVEAPAVRIAFDSGTVQSMVALSAKRAHREQTDGTAQAHVISEQFDVLADSIHALTPNQQVEQVTAVGAAYGVRKNDSIKAKLPEIASRDWLRGDTIRAFFVEAKPKPAPAPRARPSARDTAQQREIERIIASAGGDKDAQSTYRVVNEKNPDAPPSINYLVAQQITVQFSDGRVKSVKANGKIRGVHLEPDPKKPATPAPAATSAASGRS